MKKAAYASVTLALAATAFLLGGRLARHEGAASATSGSRKILYWVDPMHPAYRSDKPGIAPDCGMQLEAVYADGAGPADGKTGSAPLPAGTVRVDAAHQQAIGVRLASVSREATSRPLRATGRVAPDENRTYRILAAVDGWVRDIRNITTGSVVTKDQILGTFYAPEFLGAEQAYIFALSGLDRFQATGAETPAQLNSVKVQIRQAVDSLRNMGMTDTQIDELARTRETAEAIHIVSPVNGIVLSRDVTSGQRFERGTEFFLIADLSRVWVLADVFENQAPYLQSGKPARVSMLQQKREYPARISSVPPVFDAASRTLSVRLDVDNPGNFLRPGMFVDVEVRVDLPPALSVPADAIVDTGLRKNVFVDRGNGYFEPRRVETGWRFGDRVEIVKGLMEGERIVVSGTFLVDSESRMKAAAAGVDVNTAETDPVCGMDVDPARAKAARRASQHKGATYVFCSDICKQQFDKEPARFARQ